MGTKKKIKALLRRYGAAALAATFVLLAGCQTQGNPAEEIPPDSQTTPEQPTVEDQTQQPAEALTPLTMGEQAQKFPNVLNIYADPGIVLYGTYSTNKYNNFADPGAWHGYYHHDQDATDLYGGFAGPVMIAEEYPVNLSGAISRLQITDAAGTVYDLTTAEAEGTYYPGRLV